MNADDNSRHYRAIATCALGIAVLCGMDAVIKRLVETDDVLVVTFGRYLFGAAFALAIWMGAGRPTLTRDMWKAHALRGVVIAISSTLFYWCLSVLPLAETIVITFIAPLLVPFMARLHLGERLKPRSLLAGAAGFAGVLIAASGGDGFSADNQRLPGVAAAILSAITYALSITMLRARAGKDGAETIGVLASIIPGAIIAIPALATGEAPRLGEIPHYLLLGALATIGMFLLARAYAHAEAQVLAPIEFTALIWAAILGLVLFGETPRPQLWVGALIIIGACLWGAQPDKLQVMTPFAPGAPTPLPDEPRDH